ncbi:hypothetical protein EF888_10415 [Silicimonas algicola]|uniref:Uncharacterized protein n=2 Tax=Silicimonas algicola TaxID=1826607 RepID=A0A316G9A3_9RHOB|nr:hypothetical protein [Silicimonas algicola]AZQ67507.1 hypothetical protein EF888_10415 [Silicimonas algicola]PWK57202.1 hypothetical protein C8D95_103441 [Silicimonas algicola]
MGRVSSLGGMRAVAALDMRRVMRVVAIAVGEPVEWSQAGNALPGAGVAFVSIEEVTEALIALHAPTVVFSPVVARRFDCIDLAMRLSQIGYLGPYRAIAKDLPRPDLIEREVRQAFPNIDFAIVLDD